MSVAVIAGSTGLVGSHLLNLLLDDVSCSRVIALSRKPLSREHPKLQNMVIEFDSLETISVDLKADDVFCCLGTTIRQAGSQAAFRKVDYDYPVKLAQITKEQGARQYLLITALGSDKNSSIFYNRVKGEVEEAIGSIGFDSYHIFQPSMLLGVRKEERGGESAGKLVMKILGFAIPKRYKAVDAAKVAKGMLKSAAKKQPGTHIHSSAELQDF